jgi:hypothetical protein
MEGSIVREQELAGLIPFGTKDESLAPQYSHNMLAHMDVPTLDRPETFILEKGQLIDEVGNIGAAGRKFLQNCRDQYVA